MGSRSRLLAFDIVRMLFITVLAFCYLMRVEGEERWEKPYCRLCIYIGRHQRRVVGR